jgi:hypothetical protein
MICLFAMPDQQLARVPRAASRCTILRGTELGFKICFAGDSRGSPPDPADYLAESLRGGRNDAPDCRRGIIACSRGRVWVKLGGAFRELPSPWSGSRGVGFELYIVSTKKLHLKCQCSAHRVKAGQTSVWVVGRCRLVGVLFGETYWRCRRGGVD